MNPLGLPDPDVVEKFIKIVLGLPGQMLAQAFDLVKKNGYTISAEAEYFCLFVLAVSTLLICYRYRKYFIAWFLGLYALLITIAALLAVSAPIWNQIFAPAIQISGKIQIIQRTVADVPDTVTGDWRSNDCGVNLNREIQRCSGKGQKIYPPFNLRVDSANCGSNVENVKEDPSNPACLIVRERLQGCGYDRILGIKNCKGRGWLAYSISTSVKSENLKEVGHQKIDTTGKLVSPIAISIDTPNDIERSSLVYKYEVTLSVKGEDPIVLTSDLPSSKLVHSEIVGTELILSRSDRATENRSH